MWISAYYIMYYNIISYNIYGAAQRATAKLRSLLNHCHSVKRGCPHGDPDRTRTSELQ